MTRQEARLAAAVALAAATWALTRWARRHLRVVTVFGVSMLPAYEPGDLLAVRRVPASAIRRGDVVVVHADGPGWHQPAVNYWIIKRVAAVPGDPVAPGTLPSGQDVTVPPGQLILLGDNLADSADSRQYGYFPASDVIGRVIESGLAGPLRGRRRERLLSRLRGDVLSDNLSQPGAGRLP